MKSIKIIFLAVLLGFWACKKPKEESANTAIGTDYVFTAQDSNAAKNTQKKVVSPKPATTNVKVETTIPISTKTVATPKVSPNVGNVAKNVAKAVTTNVPKNVSKAVPTTVSTTVSKPIKTTFIGYEKRLDPITFYNRPKSFLTSTHTHTIGFQQ